MTRAQGTPRPQAAAGGDDGTGPRTPLLDRVGGPADLRALPAGLLPDLAGQIRAFLIDRVCRTGGHLGPNLGVVELTLALHRVFDVREGGDVLLFDTGHQSYVHKLLTGRREGFDGLRSEGGLSGYPSRAESAADVIENSHASTALSYADGLTKALALRGDRRRRVVALVGDGALTGGMSLEALNNLGAAPDRPVVVVLNDNGRSYAPTSGGLAAHLERLRGAAGDGGERDGREAPGAGDVFSVLGLAYLGPVDGHDTEALEEALRRAAALGRPVVVHCVTRKGLGYPPAERDRADRLHTVGVVDPRTGRSRSPSGPSWTSVFGEEVAAIGAERPEVVCVTAAMAGPTGLEPFARRFPDRVYDVGIAEQHAVTSAAGLALGGARPVVALYSTFLGRAFDQVLMDVALHRLPVVLVLDRAGVTGPDGPSHHGMWDAALLPVVPGMRLAAPRDCSSLRELLREALAEEGGPAALRYPKASAGPDVPARARIGHCDLLREDPAAEVLLLGTGPMAGACLEASRMLAARGVPATAADPRWIAPLDDALVELAAAHPLVLTAEDATAANSLGARLGQELARRGPATRTVTLALPPRFLPHGPRAGILDEHGLDPAGIAAAVLDHLPHGGSRAAAPGHSGVRRERSPR
ncbi:1-deoxy-D-xylulose-5-phosphate synthase [Nocardiopsis halophila]|uniref:1-deoxy-D-xylulose-5-phosphate synthase n=1 Tax=Nocardiopsis halophila TaxID=141692 RepID=UPI000346377C|nr:1-deoxy-D-xylulose-5-phosphate synthase [Nocardiopsis halophila]